MKQEKKEKSQLMQFAEECQVKLGSLDWTNQNDSSAILIVDDSESEEVVCSVCGKENDIAIRLFETLMQTEMKSLCKAITAMLLGAELAEIEKGGEA